MPYLPAAASLAAAHKGRIKNVRAATLRDTREDRNPGVIILTFEEESLKYDKKMKIILATQVQVTWHYMHLDHTINRLI